MLLGPVMGALSSSANPFKVVVDVTFSGPNGASYVVPAFFDGDGAGGLNGNVWKVRFSPPLPGAWQYVSHSSEPLLDGHTGGFDVTSPAGCPAVAPGQLPVLRCVGRLGYAGGHYLKFDAGPYWLKGGADDPEDFLAPGVNAGFAAKEQAIDFLASYGVNSLYIMLHNVGGDGGNVWPWVGSSQAEAKANHERFDVARLAAWEALFSYIQSKGLVLHLVLEDDSGWTGFNRGMYYREMVARFGHHNGLVWNLSEEYNENYNANGVKGFAQMLRDLDPYDHPLTVHHAGGLSQWDPFVGDPRFDLTSFQTGKTEQNAPAGTWFGKVASSGRTIAVSFDETGKLGKGDQALARHIVWSVFLGGGNFEMHTSPLSSYQDFAGHFGDMIRARAFMELLPFCQMAPRNDLLTFGQAYVFAQPGAAYAAYLPAGGSIELNLASAPGTLQVRWMDPRDGQEIEQGPIPGGDIRAFTSPFNGEAALFLCADSAGGGCLPERNPCLAVAE